MREAIRVKCPACRLPCIRLFAMGRAQACRACARPTIAEQRRAFEEARHA